MAWSTSAPCDMRQNRGITFPDNDGQTLEALNQRVIEQSSRSLDIHGVSFESNAIISISCKKVAAFEKQNNVLLMGCGSRHDRGSCYLSPVVQQGFEVKWNVGVDPCTDCMRSGGQCMYNNATRLTTCACPKLPFLADSCLSDNKTRVSSSPSSERVSDFVESRDTPTWTDDLLSTQICSTKHGFMYFLESSRNVI
ncbi:leaf rust 10 disease-resistance locus receptor-like protein kinase-like 1.3 protein [Tanacetum coccineum]|uniref:Leaf rust 10 disease-resistance locus receptor-like protein kinase-like 1.3 protein n=1 Tax=Tanacetum coccineum TaxID=301880 RepID=A0ABQ5CU34_9ASTR